jgi:hypothetical protein
MRAGEAMNDRGIGEWYWTRAVCLGHPMKEETEDE